MIKEASEAESNLIRKQNNGSISLGEGIRVGDSGGAAWSRRGMGLVGVRGKDGRGPDCVRGVQGCGTWITAAMQAGVNKAQTQPECSRAQCRPCDDPWVAVKRLWVLPFIQSISGALQRRRWAPGVGLFARNASQPQDPPPQCSQCFRIWVLEEQAMRELSKALKLIR